MGGGGGGPKKGGGGGGGGLPKEGGLRQFANLRGDLEWSGGSGVFEGG